MVTALMLGLSRSYWLARVASIDALGFREPQPGLQALWSSGDYAFDGAGNISAIGGQSFAASPTRRTAH